MMHLCEFFNREDIDYNCIQYSSALSHFYKYLLHKLTIGELCIYLVHDNEYIRNLASEIYHQKTNNYGHYYEAKLLFKLLWEERTKLWVSKRYRDGRLTPIGYINYHLYSTAYYYLKQDLLSMIKIAEKL